MDYKLAYTVQSIISSMFPGGIFEFIKEGRMIIIPNPGKEIVIYHPNLGDKLTERLMSGLDTKESITILKQKNFEGLTGEELRALNIKINGYMANLDPSVNVLFDDVSNLLVVTAPNLNDSDDILNMLKECIKNLDGLVLAYIITKKTVWRHWADKPKQITKVCDDGHVITQDDVTNFIIELERSTSIDDLLK